MVHLFVLISILALLIIYSNLFTPAYLIFLNKRLTDTKNDAKLFLATGLSMSTITLLLVFPKFAFNSFATSLSFFTIGLGLSFYYIFRNRKLVKTIYKIAKEVISSHKALLLLFFLAIFVIIIPALHYPWYFGYGVDWSQHVSLVQSTIMENGSTPYPALGVHAFFSIIDLLNLPYPELWQIGSAYFIGMSIFPLYLIVRPLVNEKTTLIALLLWVVIPYHHFMYGEFIPNGASIFFYLSFLFVIVSIIQRHVINQKYDLNTLVLCGSLLLTGAIYIHQVFLYPFFYVYLLLTLLYVLFYRRIKWLVITYAKILGLTAILLAPLLLHLYDGAKWVLGIHSGWTKPYEFSDFTHMLENNMGYIMFFTMLVGTLFYICKKKTDKKSSLLLSKIIFTSLIIGPLISINVYFQGNPFWSERSLYILEIFSVIPIAYFAISIIEKCKKKFINAIFLIIFILIFSAKIDYAMNVPALWSDDMQSSIEWMKGNKNMLKNKEVYTVMDTIKRVDRIFNLGANHIVPDLGIQMITKDDFNARPEKNLDKILIDNAFYQIIENGNEIYFYYKVDPLKSFDTLNFNKMLLAKPERTYSLDKILKRHIFTSKIDQESVKFNGSGIAISNDRKVGQKFVATTDYLSEVCVKLSKSDTTKEDPIYLELFEYGQNQSLKKAELSASQIKQIPLNVYKEFCFDVNEKTTPGNSYVFEIITYSPTQYYGVLNAGVKGYTFGSAYMNDKPIADNLLFKTKTFEYFSW